MNAITRRPTGITFRRHLRQPPAVVFAAFADPGTLAQWWGPPECPVVESSLDFRPGGIWLYQVRSVGSGAEAWSRAAFDEIVPVRRIVFTETSSDAAGAVTAGRAPARTTIELGPDEGGTLLVVDVQHVDEVEALRALERGVEGGLSRALDQLEALIEGRTEVRS